MVPEAAFLAHTELDGAELEEACQKAVSMLDRQRGRLVADMPHMEVHADMRRAETWLLWGIFDDLFQGNVEAICTALAWHLHHHRRLPIDRAQAVVRSVRKTAGDRRDEMFAAVAQSGREAARYGDDGGLLAAARYLERAALRSAESAR